MANEEQVKLLKQGVDGWNKWRDENSDIEIELGEANFEDANLGRVKLWGAYLGGANLGGANLWGANLSRADLNNASIQKADLRKIDLFGANLRAANLMGSDLAGADLRKVDLSQACLSEAILEDADLKEADLKGGYFWNANLSRANLWKTNLRSASLKNAKLYRTNLSEAKLTNAYLNEAVFFEANLSDTDFEGANLEGANFGYSYLDGAKFGRTSIGYTIFGGIDLSKVKGLDAVYHHSPSIISAETLQRSKGRIPEKFLRGCGLNDWEIESAKLYQPGLSAKDVSDIVYRIYDLRANQAIQINPLFISYSHSDSEFVDAMEERLNEKGIRFWRDIHDATAGRLEKVIDRAIRQNPIELLVLSENSIKSDWVEHEARKARDLEKELDRDILCPIALDDSWRHNKWPEHLREQIMEYNVLDFSKWKDEQEFGKMFRKLIDGLDLFYKEK